MIEVEVNGVVHEFPDGTDQGVIRAALQKKYPKQSTQSTKPTPAQEFANEHPIARTVGRAGRSAIGGLSSLADLSLLVPKTVALVGSMGADAVGMPKISDAMEGFGRSPTIRDTAVNAIDTLTGGKLQPTGAIDKVGDFTGEVIASSVPFSRAPQGINALTPKPPTAGTALQSVLDPETALNQLPSIQKAQAVPRPTSESIRKGAGNLYKTATEKGGVIKSEAVDSFIDDLQLTVKPQDEVAAALTKDDPANEALGIFEELMRGKKMTLERLQAVDEALTKKIDKFTEFGKPKKEAYGLVQIQDKLRKTIQDADESIIEGGKEGFSALSQGRKEWSKAARVRDIESIISRAEMSDQPANAMRAGFKTLYNNPNRMRGYSKAEKDLIKRAAKDNLPMELLRGTASRLTGIGAAVYGGPAGFVVGKGAEMGARGIREGMANARAQGIIDLISGYNAPQTFEPLLTDTGGLAAISSANVAGQRLLSPPQPNRAEAMAKYLSAPVTEMTETQTNTVLPPLNAPMVQPEAPLRQPNGFLDRVAMAESGGNPNARAKTSSASGMYQFTDPTWKGMVKNYGAQTGITLADKNDPDKQKIMADLLTKENTNAYKKAGFEPNDADLYAAHFLGGPAAVKAKKNPEAYGAALFPQAAKANQSIFYNKGRPRTNAEINALLGKKVGV